MQPSSLPLTLTLSLRGRGKWIALVVVGLFVACWSASAFAETWRCTRPDGSVVYSDQNLSGECRKLEALPPLLRVPSVPPGPAEEAKPEPPAPEPAQVPTPRRGRRIDPPSDAIITIRDLNAVPDLNNLL